MADDAPIGELVARVAQEAVDVVSAEVDRARAEIDLRARFGMRVLVRAGLTMIAVGISLQAFAVAAILWSATLFDGYLPGAVVVGSVFLALAGAGGLLVRRAAMLAIDPIRDRQLPAPPSTALLESSSAKEPI